MSEKNTSWIVKGAKVVRLSGHKGNEALSVTTDHVAKVNKRTFVLTSDGEKVSLTTLLRETSGAWDPRYEVVHPDDPRVAAVLAEIEQKKAQTELHSAYELVRREPTRDNIDGLRAATNALDKAVDRAALARTRAALPFDPTAVSA